MTTQRVKKIDLLKQWCVLKGTFNTVEIQEYGLRNFYISAQRQVRILAEEGFLRAISYDEAILKGLIKPNQKCIRWYELEK